MQPEQKQQTREEFIKGLFQLEEEDNVHLDGSEGLMRGVDKAANAIAPSYGAAGTNVPIEVPVYPYFKMTNDCKTILDSIKYANPLERMGLNIEKEVADRSDKESGDGRKTAVLLSRAILRESKKYTESPMEIKRSLEACLPIILESIDKQKRPITPDEVGIVATNSSENEYIGSLFQEIYQKIGKDGMVEIDNSNLPETFYEITEGVRLRNMGFTYPYMANDEKGQSSTYLVPKVLITKQKISNIQDIDPILKALSAKSINELVIMCEDIDPTVSGILAYRHAGYTPQGQQVSPFKVLVLKAPILWKDWIYEDFAKITGANIIDPALGKTLKNLKFEDLGTCDKITAFKDETRVHGIHDIQAHIKRLEAEGTDESKLRISWLQTKTAVLKLGAHTDTELAYLRAKASDARNASYLALQDGIVIGGGVALLNIRRDLPDTIGGKILKEILSIPTIQICENAGVKIVVNADFEFDQGFNAKTKSFVDMFEAGIVDPSIVVKNSIKNAISISSNILTGRVVVTAPKQ